MITQIQINNVACYKKSVKLETDKKINLIYGLNGTGKSTLSNYLYNQSDPKYSDCSIEGLDTNCDILVYNQAFIRDVFFESDNLKGIFTLSSANKIAETKIADAQKEVKRIDLECEKSNKILESAKNAISQKRESAKRTVWEIKKKYTGGDRVLEFCLEGYKSDGNKLLDYIVSLEKPNEKPTQNIDALKIEAASLTSNNAQKYDALALIQFDVTDIETDTIFTKQIVGNKNSTVSSLIENLSNSDWVKEGLKYLPSETEKGLCPFCQEETITPELIKGSNLVK